MQHKFKIGDTVRFNSQHGSFGILEELIHSGIDRNWYVRYYYGKDVKDEQMTSIASVSAYDLIPIKKELFERYIACSAWTPEQNDIAAELNASLMHVPSISSAVSNGPLTFVQLRMANVNRLPLFKNSKGSLAHSKEDGSDWSPAQWLQAIVGELGEYANFRKKFDRGDINAAQFQKEAEKELADVMIYLDILAFQLRIDLGEAVRAKFNEVSKRINVDVRL